MKIFFILLIFIYVKCLNVSQVLSEDQLRLILDNFDEHQLGEILNEIENQYEPESHEEHKLTSSSPHSYYATVDDIIEKSNLYPDLYSTTNLGNIFEPLFDILKPTVMSDEHH
jgi:hypothetical protein